MRLIEDVEPYEVEDVLESMLSNELNTVADDGSLSQVLELMFFLYNKFILIQLVHSYIIHAISIFLLVFFSFFLQISQQLCSCYKFITDGNMSDLELLLSKLSQANVSECRLFPGEDSSTESEDVRYITKLLSRTMNIRRQVH